MLVYKFINIAPNSILSDLGNTFLLKSSKNNYLFGLSGSIQNTGSLNHILLSSFTSCAYLLRRTKNFTWPLYSQCLTRKGGIRHYTEEQGFKMIWPNNYKWCLFILQVDQISRSKEKGSRDWEICAETIWSQYQYGHVSWYWLFNMTHSKLLMS